MRLLGVKLRCGSELHPVLRAVPETDPCIPWLLLLSEYAIKLCHFLLVVALGPHPLFPPPVGFQLSFVAF